MVSSFGTRVGADGTLSRALGPAKEDNYALESLQGYIVWGCWELKRKFRIVLHGNLLYHGTYKTIDYPGATLTFCGGLNAQGDIAGQYNDAQGVAHSFLLSHGVFTGFDPPGAAGFSAATGINPAGIIVGVFFDADGNEHGYIC